MWIIGTNWSARFLKACFLKTQWKRQMLKESILCFCVHCMFKWSCACLWVHMQRTNDCCLFYHSSLPSFLKQSLTDLEVQCFSQTGRSLSSQDLPVSAHPTPNTRITVMCIHASLFKCGCWGFEHQFPYLHIKHCCPLSHYPKPENILKSDTWYLKKEFIFRICDGHFKLKTNTFQKWVNCLNQHFIARKTYRRTCKTMPRIISYWRSAQR